MSLLDSIKKGTGIGLSHSEHYNRAYERGVLLGVAKYAEASSLFDEAARRAQQAGDHGLQMRALANSALYGFISSGNPQHLAALAQTLPELPAIEVIGSPSETMAIAGLLAEVNARLVEAEIGRMNAADHLGLTAAHERAAMAFKAFFTAPLITYRFQSGDGHVDTAQSRFFYHQGLGSWHHAFAAVGTSPEGAAEHMGKALVAFRQCNDTRWADDAQAWLTNCRMKRTCWMCNREVQGATFNFKSYPAVVNPYMLGIVSALGQDTSMLDTRGSVVLCTTCGSVVERQAEAYANARALELRALYDGQIAQLNAAVNALNHSVAALRFAR